MNDDYEMNQPMSREISYGLSVPTENYSRQFTDEEKSVLRPIAEALAMLDGNAFFSMTDLDGRGYYEQYLPEAAALFESNGGIDGWAGDASWVRELDHESPAVKDAYDSWRTLKSLSKNVSDR
jgi:hypothetical protein